LTQLSARLADNASTPAGEGAGQNRKVSKKSACGNAES
jgi:hypothetical protein